MSAPAKTNLKQQLLDYEKKNWEALKARDTETLKSLISDPYVMVMEDGIFEQRRSDFVKSMVEGDMQLKSYTLYEDTVTARELAPGVAFIAYKARPEMVENGKTLVSDYFFGTTFVKKGDHWIGAAGSASKAEPPK